MQLITQKYIAAKNLYRSQMRAVETDEMIEGKSMQEFCDRIGTKRNVIKENAPVIKFMEAAYYLKTQPKFPTTIGGSA